MNCPNEDSPNFSCPHHRSLHYKDPDGIWRCIVVEKKSLEHPRDYFEERCKCGGEPQA